MSVVVEVTPITFEGTVLKEHFSRLTVCSYPQAGSLRTKHTHSSESTLCSILLRKFGVFQQQDSYRNAFLANTFALERRCKSTNFLQTCKKNILLQTGKVVFLQPQ
mgnify:CR=1 FL=1